VPPRHGAPAAAAMNSREPRSRAQRLVVGHSQVANAHQPQASPVQSMASLCLSLLRRNVGLRRRPGRSELASRLPLKKLPAGGPEGQTSIGACPSSFAAKVPRHRIRCHAVCPSRRRYGARCSTVLLASTGEPKWNFHHTAGTYVRTYGDASCLPALSITSWTPIYVMARNQGHG
jgi:hypothetical protein